MSGGVTQDDGQAELGFANHAWKPTIGIVQTNGLSFSIMILAHMQMHLV